jgi:hypothetical protein
LLPLLRRVAGQPRIKSLSVFALAPIPLLVHLGQELGDIECVDLYQRHRDRQDWTWREEEEGDDFYEVRVPEVRDGHGCLVALLLSVSDPVLQERVVAALGSEPRMYEIRAKTIGREFLRSRRRVEVFGQEVAKLLTRIRESHEHDRVIHVFSALPAPLAIEFGRAIKGFDPPFTVYEYRKTDRTFFAALTINARPR